MTQRLRVGIIGVGAIARNEHLPAWRQLRDVEVVAVADTSPSSLEFARRDFGIERHENDYRRLLDDPSIDVVDICVPSALHARVTIDSLQAGKHVFCEKPMATSGADAAAVVAAWRAARRKLMIGQHMRFEPSVELLRRYLEQHPPGDIYYARAQWLRRRRVPGSPTFVDRSLSGGGALYDLGVHMLDLAWWMMGSPRPAAVSGAAFNHLARRGDLGGEWGEWDAATFDVDDFAAGLIRFENGSLLSLEASWLAFQPEREFWKLQLFGTRAGVIWPEGQLAGEEDRIPWTLDLGPTKGPPGHHRIIHEFARAVLEDRPAPVPPDHSATVIEMLDALYHSSATGREVSLSAEPRAMPT